MVKVYEAGSPALNHQNYKQESSCLEDLTCYFTKARALTVSVKFK